MEGHIPNRIPPFDGNNYAYWRNIMQTCLKNLRVDIWFSFVNGYNFPKNTPTYLYEKKLMSCDSKDNHFITSGLTPNVSSKVMGCNKTKEVWENIKSIYEGDPKFKHVKLQRHRVDFENLKMDEKEDIASYLLRVDEVFNAIK